MRGELTTLSGPSRPDAVLNPSGLSNFDAGLLFFAALTRRFPDLTWKQFFELGAGGNPLSGWLTDIGHDLASAARSTVAIVGGIGGDTVRLATDQQVISGISRAGSAIATGGASEGVNSVTSALSTIFTPAQTQTVTAAGQVYNAQVGGGSLNWKNPIVIVGAVLLGGVTLLSLGKFVFKGGK